MVNPFEVLEKRLANIENILLDDVRELKQLMIKFINAEINSENIKGYYETKLTDIFSTRVSRIMKGNEVITLDDLVEFVKHNGIEELYKLRNFGEKCMIEVVSYLDAKGIDYKH